MSNRVGWLGLGLGLLGLCLTLTGCPLLFPVVMVGAGTGAYLSQDRRSFNIQINDQKIELTIRQEFLNYFGLKSNITTTVWRGKVLLTGEVPDEATRQRAEKSADKFEGVVQVYNRLLIAPPSEGGERLADAALTTKVKSAMVSAARFPVGAVRVVTEHGEVHLLGTLYPQEQKDAAAIASRVEGVAKVLTLFDIPEDTVADDTAAGS